MAGNPAPPVTKFLLIRYPYVAYAPKPLNLPTLERGQSANPVAGSRHPPSIALVVETQTFNAARVDQAYRASLRRPSA